MIFPTEDMVKQRLEAAKATFLANDSHLLEVNASERSMTHKFAEALQQIFRCWHVDCEYNRVGYDARGLKTLPEWAKEEARKSGRVFPDIIIHQRGDAKNAIVIEAKPSTANNERIKSDESKLRAYKQELGYKHAIQITFYVFSVPNITWEFIG